VCGFDRDEGQAGLAVRRGLVDGVTGDLDVELGLADMVVLAAPVKEIVDLVRRVDGRAKPGAVLTDVGSAKSEIVRAMGAMKSAIRAVGGHPMTGKTASGAESASPDLFRGAGWAIVQTTSSDEEAVARVERLVRSVGARPVRMSAPLHDRMVSVTSHLPAVMAVALVQLAAGLGDEPEHGAPLAGPGFASASRLAAGDPSMTAQMLQANAANLAQAVEALTEKLHRLAGLAARDGNELAVQLAEAQVLRASLARGDE
jgi:prephenate dehydrogenase